MIDEWGKGAKYWDKAWNPVVGCEPVSEGCDNCYAKALWSRFHPGTEFKPEAVKKAVPRKGVVFVGNMTDLFGEWNTDEQIVEWLTTTPSMNAKNLVLTKRVNRMSRIIRQCWNPSIHLGMTAENQNRYNERINDFRTILSYGKKWLSAEPLLSHIDMQLQYIAPEDMPFDWVVVGAESGKDARPCKLEWIESIVEQCRAASVPVFVKQIHIGGKLVTDIGKFPAHFQIRQVPWK